MKREQPGTYTEIQYNGEDCKAFVPSPLPPDPPIRLDDLTPTLFGEAALALGRLDAISSLVPDKELFLYQYVRKEAVLSSQIEGTQSSLSDLLMHELKEKPGVPLDDVVEVSNYVAAVEHGLGQLKKGAQLSNGLLREIHSVLMRDKAPEMAAGEFRRDQNWIGGPRPSRAEFVPPPPKEVQRLMVELDRFLHAEGDGMSPLLLAGLAHVQFETIHPFLDGNGRVGRILITLLLYHAGVLRQPLLYLSLHFKQNRSEYYSLLSDVREHGDWEAWMEFFLEGVRDVAEGAVFTAQRLSETFERDRSEIGHGAGRRAGSVLRVLDKLAESPILSIGAAAEFTQLSFSAAAAAMNWLAERGIVTELTRKSRNRLYVYNEYLRILSEGTE